MPRQNHQPPPKWAPRREHREQTDRAVVATPPAAPQIPLRIDAVGLQSRLRGGAAADNGDWLDQEAAMLPHSAEQDPASRPDQGGAVPRASAAAGRGRVDDGSGRVGGGRVRRPDFPDRQTIEERAQRLYEQRLEEKYGHIWLWKARDRLLDCRARSHARMKLSRPIFNAWLEVPFPSLALLSP